MSEWMCWHESDWKDDPSGNGKEPTEPGDRCLPDDFDFCTLLSGSSESSFVFSPPDCDHVIRSVGGSSTTSSVQVEKPHVVFTLSVDAKGKDCEVDESINVNVTIDLKQETTSTTHAEVLSHSVPADRLVWSPTLRPLDRLLATNIEMARLQQQLGDVEENGENEERVKRPRNAFMFFCSNQRPELQKLYPGLNNRTISQMLGAMWRSLSNEEKLPFQGEAAKEREDHKKQHPDWKYSIDKAKGVKRKIKAVKKLQRAFEREIKGKCTKKETLHDHTVTALDELWSPIEWTGGGNTQCLEISNIHTSEPAACWVTPSDREQELCGLTVSTALDLLDCHTDVDPDSVDDSVLDGQCDDQTAPMLPKVDELNQIVHEHDITMFGCTDQHIMDKCMAESGQMLMQQVPSSSFSYAFAPMPKRNKKKSANPYSFGCRRYYGMTSFDLWCNGCKQKKRCCRNDQISCSATTSQLQNKD